MGSFSHRRSVTTRRPTRNDVRSVRRKVPRRSTFIPNQTNWPASPASGPWRSDDFPSRDNKAASESAHTKRLPRRATGHPFPFLRHSKNKGSFGCPRADASSHPAGPEFRRGLVATRREEEARGATAAHAGAQLGHSMATATRNAASGKVIPAPTDRARARA